MNRPVAAADAALVALCCEFHCISNLIGQADDGLDIDEAALNCAVERYYVVVQQIADTEAATDAGRQAKVRAAFVAMLFLDEPPRVGSLVKSALSDLIAEWSRTKVQL